MERKRIEVRSESVFPEGAIIRDLRIDIYGEIEVERDITFENCDIYILGSKDGQLNFHGVRVTLYDCKLYFEYGGAIVLDDADLELDGCCCAEWDSEYQDYLGNLSVEDLWSHLFGGAMNYNSEEPSEEDIYPHIMSIGNKKDITIRDTTFEQMRGPMILSYGTNVYVEDCYVDRHYGMFLFVRSGEYVPDNFITCQPVCSVRNTVFKRCKQLEFSEDDKQYILYIEREDPNLQDLQSCMFRDDEASSSALIVTALTARLTVQDTTFAYCSNRCIVANDAHGPAILKDCKFDVCGVENDNSYREKMPVQLHHIKAQVEGCNFFSCGGGLYYHAQCYGMEMNQCKFTTCDGKCDPEKGILYIFTENEEPKSYIKECDFQLCKSDGPLVRIGAFEPSSRQRGNVVIEDCSFMVSSSSQEVIRGEEMGSGFFASKVTLYQIVGKTEAYRIAD